MNIDTQAKITSVNTSSTTSSKTQKESDVKFSDELNQISKSEKEENIIESKTDESKKEDVKVEQKDVNEEKKSEIKKEDDIENVIGGLQQTVQELNKLNQKNDKINISLKDNTFSDDKEKEDNNLIDNNINIQEKKEQQLPQMNANMNFNSNGQPFAAFVQNNNENNQLSASESDLAEENAILSTMSENMAIAQKNMLLKKDKQNEIAQSVELENVQPQEQSENNVETPKTKTVTNEQGIKKVDAKTNITTDTVVKFDDIAMNKNDVEFFANLVENGSVDMNSVTNSQKSSQVSKTLADMLAKSMEDNKPIRINFDNDISVIIKINKNGKISADFLPSSQVAEAYLKENLPILKQRFDDNNIDYEELNHRKQEQQDDRNNRKKGRKDE
ncbi:hypothetical protein EGQ24_00415 [bacterium]|nr:hypothetical protein [bacterium]